MKGYTKEFPRGFLSHEQAFFNEAVGVLRDSNADGLPQACMRIAQQARSALNAEHSVTERKAGEIGAKIGESALEKKEENEPLLYVLVVEIMRSIKYASVKAFEELAQSPEEIAEEVLAIPSREEDIEILTEAKRIKIHKELAMYLQSGSLSANIEAVSGLSADQAMVALQTLSRLGEKTQGRGGGKRKKEYDLEIFEARKMIQLAHALNEMNYPHLLEIARAKAIQYARLYPEDRDGILYAAFYAAREHLETCESHILVLMKLVRATTQDKLLGVIKYHGGNI